MSTQLQERVDAEIERLLDKVARAVGKQLNQEMVAEVRQLRREVAELRAQVKRVGTAATLAATTGIGVRPRRGGKVKSPCAMASCGEPAASLSLCRRHYARYRYARRHHPDWSEDELRRAIEVDGRSRAVHGTPPPVQPPPPPKVILRRRSEGPGSERLELPPPAVGGPPPGGSAEQASTRPSSDARDDA